MGPCITHDSEERPGPESGAGEPRRGTASPGDPLAVASIAQVHHAVLHDGREVVVKIRRPGKFRINVTPQNTASVSVAASEWRVFGRA